MQILIADDHGLFRAGLRQLLERAFPQARVLESADAPGTLEQVRAHPELALVLLDLAMPGARGVELVRALGQCAPAVPVAVLSASEEPMDVRAALAAGAAGFIPKSAGDEVLVGALRLVLAGDVYVPPLLLTARPVPVPEDVAALTPRQRDVLALLAQGRSNKEIAAELALSEATVKQHVSAILRTLKPENRTQAVLVATRLAALPAAE